MYLILFNNMSLLYLHPLTNLSLRSLRTQALERIERYFEDCQL